MGNLTKDSDAVICVMYKAYLENRERGISKADAKQFGEAEDLHISHFPNLSIEDLNETILELKRAGLVDCEIWIADNDVGDIAIKDAGIIYMENRFKNGIKGVLDYLGKIKSVIPFL